MAQFGGAKNPPWVRPAGEVGLGPAALQMGQPTIQAPPPTVYSLATTQPTLAQQQYAAAQQLQMQPPGPQAMLPQPGIAIPTSLASNQLTVSYPAPGVGNVGNVGVRGPPPTTTAPPPTSGPQAKQRVFTSTVSKLHDNFGFVDEDVFFQTSCVKGNQPKVGDRVLVEATYNANMPFRWNATRIQLLPNQTSEAAPTFNRNTNMTNIGSQISAPQMNTNTLVAPITTPQHGNSNLGGVPQISNMPNVPQNSNFGFHQNSQPLPNSAHQPPPLMGANQMNNVSNMSQQQQPQRLNVQSRSRNESNYQRDRDRDRSDRGDRNDRQRDRDNRHDRERRRSPRKRSRSPRRSRSPVTRTHSPPRRRPRVIPRYMVQFPKISLDTKDANVITLKARYNNLYIPSDFFNTQFSWADVFPIDRPFSLGNPCNYHVMNKEIAPIEKNEAILEPSDASHFYSAKVVLMASPTLEDLYRRTCGLSEDSQEVRDAFQHPTRIIQFLVGLKGKNEPMAIGGPWSPSLDGQNPDKDPTVLIRTAIRTTQALTGINLSCCTHWYRFAEMRYQRPAEHHHGRLVPARIETVVIFLPDVWSCSPTQLEWENINAAYKKQLRQKLGPETSADPNQEAEKEGEDDLKEPSHYTLLDPKTMKVSELRTELEARQLSNKGLKSQMIARLTKTLKSEQEKAEEEAEKKQAEPTKEEEQLKLEAEEKEERKKREEEDKQRRDDKLEKRYTLPEHPAIIVHPHATAKSGKFDCTVMSLSVLLDYRPEDNKEHSFEVSLFAELFNEMLMRDFAFEIYKYLYNNPEKDKLKKSEVKSESKESNKESSKEQGKDSKEGSKEKKEEENKEEEVKEDEEMETDQPTPQEEEEKPRATSITKENKETGKETSKDSSVVSKKRSKVVSVHRPFLLACVYFDQTHTGYLVDKDLEDILHIMGLHLSRAQIRKLVSPVLTRDVFNYRKITDKQQNHDVKDDDKSSSTEDEVVDASMLLGNRMIVDSLRHGSTQKAEPSGSVQVKQEEDSDCTKPPSETNPNMIVHQGALIDVASLMQRLEKADKTRTAIEERYKKLKVELDEVKASHTASEQNAQKLSTELHEQKRRLRDQRKSLTNTENLNKSYKDMLTKVSTTLKDLQENVQNVKNNANTTESEQINGN